MHSSAARSAVRSKPLPAPKPRPLPAGHPRSPPPPPPAPERPDFRGPLPLPTLVRYYKYPFVGAALAAGLLGAYGSYLLTAFLRAGAGEPCCGPHAEPAPPTGLPAGAALARASAAEFDAGLDWPETVTGLARLRRRLARRARGHVLEVAVGTGRNLAHYDWDDVAAGPDAPRRALRQLEKRRGRRSDRPDADEAGVDPEVASYTGVDIAPAVLDVARAKLRAAVPGGSGAIPERADSAAAAVDAGGSAEVLRAFDGRVRLIRADAQQPLPAPPAGPGYDTVVQTFGLCSVADPAALLGSLARAVRPGSGRILLLEHGRGARPFVDGLLDRYAARHFERFGCWWNRDVEALVRAAAATVPGLEVVELTRPGWLHFGTTVLVELKVNPVAARGGGATEER